MMRLAAFLTYHGNRAADVILGIDPWRGVNRDRAGQSLLAGRWL